MKLNEELLEQLENLSTAGSLTLGIFCAKCDAQFELGREGAALAFIMGASFMEYLSYVQGSKCPRCNNRDKNE